ncbi:DUF1028 domain-containing protein [Cellulomonas sp. URHE0023]|uniref:DUF1028 domain-containing protein n=1 Tax=Cellulomonas sp. URHE0023 TaxID=1380354 RepID=UPI00047FD636|nr:DUF1028 domain-containing protein [Cellulomonas sp. URHE0023]
MTFSLVARDGDGRTFGVATASKYLAVGSTVPAVSAGIGALATQARTNVAYRERGMRLLRAGVTATRTVHGLVEPDEERDVRQVAVVAGTGEPAAWTGSGCWPAAGQLVAEDCVAVGNFLADQQVLGSMVDAFAGATGSLARRLLVGLAAGQDAGGDVRGRQSAALLVASGQGVVKLRTAERVDLRVDDHLDPVGELGRLLTRFEVLVADPDPSAALTLDGPTAREVDDALQVLGVVDGDLAQRLRAWAITENLHYLLLEGAVDRLLLSELRAHVAVRLG